jgi:hypothetical protein
MSTLPPPSTTSPPSQVESGSVVKIKRLVLTMVAPAAAVTFATKVSALALKPLVAVTLPNDTCPSPLTAALAEKLASFACTLPGRACKPFLSVRWVPVERSVSSSTL